MSLQLGFKKTAETRRRRESVRSTQFRLVEEVNVKGEAVQSTSGGMQIIVTLLRSWSKAATSREHRLPSPQRGRGAGGEGDTSLLNQLPKLGSG